MTKTRPFGPLAAIGALVIAAAAVTFPVQADQHDGDSPARMERHIERMAERLALEDDQIDLIRAILQDSRAQARAIHEGTADDRRSAMEALRAETDARLAEVLTPAQMEEMFATRENRREMRGERRRERAEDRFVALAERLELADSQVEPVREILASSRAEGRAIFETLREEDLERDEMRARAQEQMAAIRAETEAQLAGVLTPAQMETLAEVHAEMRDERPRRRRMRFPEQS